jgi:hypothetical protein
MDRTVESTEVQGSSEVFIKKKQQDKSKAIQAQ